MSSWTHVRRFDLVEVCGVAIAVAGISWLGARWTIRPLKYGEASGIQEAANLRAAYGPSRFSEHQEEWVIRDYFGDRRDGYFVDVGANDYREFSNTYYLESRLGWSGLAIEPQVRFAEGYRSHRPRTRFLPLFASDVSNAQARLFLHESNPLVTSSSREYAERWGADLKEIQVPTITLTDLLDQLGIKRLDLLSIDVELSEPKVLAGFDIDRFKPSLVCIEACVEVRQFVLDYFARHRYVLLGKYIRADQDNLYFAPLG